MSLIYGNAEDQGTPSREWEDPIGDSPATPLLGVDELELELGKEAITMALYVAICLLAALIAIPEGPERNDVWGLIWGITLGLATAHWFAFRVSSRMVGAGTIRTSDIELAGAQLLGAAAVAVVVTLGVLLLPDSMELQGAELLLAALISLIGFAVARGAGTSVLRAVAYSIVVLVSAVIIATLKNMLAGH